MIAPAIVIFLVFSIYPILYMGYLSFNEWDLINPVKTFTGLSNFIDLFKDETFLRVVKNSVVYMFITVSVTMILGTLLASKHNFCTIYSINGICSIYMEVDNG